MKSLYRDLNLEYAQRDYTLNVDAPMVFDEKSIANVIQRICEEEIGDAFGVDFLLQLAEAFRGNDKDFKIRMSHRKQSKYRSPADTQMENARDYEIYVGVLKLESEGWKKEAAIKEVGTKWELGRTAIFESLKRAEKLQKTLREFREAMSPEMKKKAAEFREKHGPIPHEPITPEAWSANKKK